MAERVESEKLANEALALRVQGYTIRAVAIELNIAVTTCYDMSERAIRQITRENAEAYVALECERLDALTKAVWQPAMRGDLNAVDRVLRIMERRAKLLGLDADAKVRVKVDPTDGKSIGELLAEIHSAVEETRGTT